MDHPQVNHSTTGLILVVDPTGYYAKTESWNGTSVWTEVNDLATGKRIPWWRCRDYKRCFMQVETTSPGNINCTEEWTFPPPTAAILTEGSIFLSGGTTLKGFGKAAGIPAATWASGGSLKLARRNHVCSLEVKLQV